ncbi:MAG: IclR family transcriptional regulator [Pseudomonadota bacterium]
MATHKGDGSAPAGTVGKALDVLDAVAAFGRPVKFAELLASSDHPKATLYRLVQTLVATGMLAYDPDRQVYGLGLRLVRLAHGAWAQASLAPLARPHLDRLSAQVGETVHLAQLDHGQVLYVDKRNARQPTAMFSDAGKVGPAYCTGVGKVMLAHLEAGALDDALGEQAFRRYTDTTHVSADTLRAELDDIRARGYGFDREEHEPGIRCVALPILTATGRLLGALSVTGPADRVSYDSLEGQVPLIRGVAQAIAADASDWGFPEPKAARVGTG